MATYKYIKLNQKNDEIRLIRLLPGQWEDDILCDIFHTPLLPPKYEVRSKRLSLEELQEGLPDGVSVKETLDGRYLFIHNGPYNSWDHPNPEFDRTLYELKPQKTLSEYKPIYEALSYTWGPMTKPVVLHVLGQVPTRLGIGINLATALKHLRHPDQPRTIWVDAICINQDDVLERNHEVSRMKSVYSFAKRTIIWLGEEAQESTRAIATLEYFAQQVEFVNGGTLGDSPDAKNTSWWEPGSRLPFDEDDWSCLIAFFRRSWFNRVWVLQEALLGSQTSIIQCGKTSILWLLLRKAMLVLARNRTIPRELRSLLESYRLGILPRAMSGLLELLGRAKFRQCVDPRDKIYGVLGLVSPLIANNITVDYSMATAQVYMSTLLSCIFITKRIDLLQHCRITQRLENGPSWIPNWAFNGGSTEVDNELGRRASGCFSAQTQYIAPNVLEVAGIYCARVSSVAINYTCNPKETLQAIRRLEPEGHRTKGYIAGGSLLDAFLETTLQGRTIERYPKFYQYPSLKDIKSDYLEASSVHTQNKKSIPSAMYEYFEPSVFITTQEGYLGVTGPGVEINDYLCVLLGCGLPVLLRPTKGGKFMIVGPCFAHGLMDGEAILGPIPSPWKVEVYRRPPPRLWSNDFIRSPNVRTLHDPRLPPLPAHWEELGKDGFYNNILTGKTMTSDPRMLPEGLRASGLELKMFRLI